MLRNRSNKGMRAVNVAAIITIIKVVDRVVRCTLLPFLLLDMCSIYCFSLSLSLSLSFSSCLSFFFEKQNQDQGLKQNYTSMMLAHRGLEMYSQPVPSDGEHTKRRASMVSFSRARTSVKRSMLTLVLPVIRSTFINSCASLSGMATDSRGADGSL